MSLKRPRCTVDLHVALCKFLKLQITTINTSAVCDQVETKMYCYINHNSAVKHIDSEQGLVLNT